MTSHKPPEPSKTLIGMPSDMQEALQKLKEAEEARAKQSGILPELSRTQHGHSFGGKNAPPPIPGGRPTFQSNLPTDPQGAAHRVASLNRTLIGVVPVDLQALIDERASQASALAPTIEINETKPIGDLEHHAHERTHSGVVQRATPSVSEEPEDLPAPRLRFDDEPPPRTSDDRFFRMEQQRRARTLEAAQHPPPPPKRWPALVLLGLVFVGLAVVIALRAPRLLPKPLAAALGAEQAVVPPPAAETSVAAATSAPHEPVRAPVTIPRVEGPAAELEKQAIERLIAKDYAGAAELYLQLKAAAPERAEYAAMVELLAHAGQGAGCGRPGQEPCATP